MEAMTLGYPPEQAGQISVTATKEEWRQVIDRLEYTEKFGPNGGPERLVSWLINQGVYED